jgi:transposase-like protein
MARFSETWQHPAIYNLIDDSSNLLSTCSRVRPIFITRSALLHLVGDSAQRFSPAVDVID